MGDLAFLRQDAENRPYRGVSRRIGQVGHYFRDGGFAAPEEDVHDLALASSERFVRTMGRHRSTSAIGGVLIFQHITRKVKRSGKEGQELPHKWTGRPHCGGYGPPM